MTTAIVPYQEGSRLLTVVDLYDIDVQAGVSFLAANVSLATTPSVSVVSCVFSEPGILSIVVTKDGVDRVMQLNSGVALRAGCLYSFSHVVDAGEEVNYRYSATCISSLFKVQAVTPEQTGATTDSITTLVSSVLPLMVMMMFMTIVMKDTKE